MPTKAIQRILSFTFLVTIVAGALLPAAALAQTVTYAPYINFLEVTKNPFDPNEEPTYLRYELQNSSALVAIYIYDPDDGSSQPIKTLESGSTRLTDIEYMVKWSGKYENQQIVPENTYEFEIVAWNTNTGLSDRYDGEVTVAYGASQNAPVISGANANPSTIDPDKDQKTTISWQTDMQAQTTLAIYDKNNVLVKTLLNPTNQTGGSVIWDGTRTSGTKVLDDVYTYKITACNPAHLTYCDEETGIITVKRTSDTAPNITNVYLSDYNFDPDTETSTNLYWTIDKQADLTVELLNGNNGTERTFLDNTEKAAGSYYISWNGDDSNGDQVEDDTYTFRIAACNVNDSSLCDTETINVIVDSSGNNGGAEPTITNDFASPNPFNSDNQSTKIYYTLDKTADVTVEVWDGSTLVDTLLDDLSRNSGQNNLTWDGRNSNNNYVNDDTYTYKITACNTYGCDTETGSVEVDTNGSSTDEPTISNDYATPNPFDPDDETTNIYFTLDESADVTVEIYDGTTRVETLWDDASRNSGQSYVTWDGDDRYGNQVDDDTYTYKITACNSYGCDTETGNVEVDSTGNGGNNDDLIGDIHVNNEIFNPEDDERAQLCFDILQDNTEILVQVMDGNHVVDTLINYVEYDETNNRCVYWDGEDDDNNIVNDDVYQFRIRAENGNDTQVEYAYTEVDTDGIIIGFPNDNDCGGYTDIDPNSPFCKALALLNFRGVFTGYPDGSFRPYQVINRAETVKVNMLALDYDILADDNSNLGFWDVQRGAWYMPYLRTAKRYGVINGYPDSSFRPNYSVNRVELLKIFLESTDINLPHCNVAPYPDTPVSYDTRWYMDYACFAKAFGLMRTDAQGNFNPAAPMTRADVVDLFYQFEKRGLFGTPNWDYYNSYYDTYNPSIYYSPSYPIYYY